MPTSRLLPGSTGSNGWWEILPDVVNSQTLSGKHRVNTVILGGGICGIATAHRLGELRPNDEIALLEAEKVGFGASGRNAGFMLNVHSHGPPKNTDILRRNMKLWEAGLDDLRDKVQRFQIQCNWSEAGRFYGAAGKDGEKHLAEISETMEHLGHECKWLSRLDLERMMGTQFYTQGLYAPGSALVNPAALMRGLARNLPANVALFEETPALGFERQGTGFVIKTAGGEIQADRLVLATGIFLEHLGIGKKRFVPMATYASMTPPLSDTELGCLGEAREFGLLGGSAHGSTIRLTQDKRLFVRNYFHYHPGASASEHRQNKITEMHRSAMHNRWPGLCETRFEHSWGGVMAFTQNNGAVFGEFEPNLYAVLTNDVSPMTRGAASGALLADLIENHDSDLLKVQLSIPDASRLPPRPILDLGIALRKGSLHMAARQEF